MMRNLKDVFDPQGIMNPYKIFAQHITCDTRSFI